MLWGGLKVYIQSAETVVVTLMTDTYSSSSSLFQYPEKFGVWFWPNEVKIVELK